MALRLSRNSGRYDDSGRESHRRRFQILAGPLQKVKLELREFALMKSFVAIMADHVKLNRKIASGSE
jgi:hypothetical protein